MYNIAICIPTYKRPLMLKRLVLSINQSNLDKSIINRISIIIVDNDVEKTAERTVFELMQEFHDPFTIAYHNYPIKGLSHVRNELLRKSLELQPDFIVFIDDDEYASAEWLNKLIETLVDNNCDMAMGPIISVFESKVSQYISCWFEKPPRQRNIQLKYISTGNLIMKTDSLLKNKIWFDHRFNYTGSEDSYFGLQMIKQGASVYWAPNAIVYETIPKKRANIKWLIKRVYRGASTYAFVLKIEKNHLGMLKKTLINIVYFLCGGMALVIIPFPFRWKYWGILKISESIGGFAGLFGFQFNEYAKAR